MKRSELRNIIREMILKEAEGHIEPESGPFPAEFHEFMHSMKHEFPGADAHRIMRETLKKTAVDNGLDAAVDYVLEQFPQYKKFEKQIKDALTADKIDHKVKFE